MFDSPRLIADIGGTYARFAVETAPGTYEHARLLRCADHADFRAAVTAYLDGLPVPRIAHAGVAIANPVDGDQVRMTNYPWQFSIEEMRQRLRFDTLVVVNDFTALAMAVPELKPSQRYPVGHGRTRERSVVGVLGAGTGLGVSGLIPSPNGWVALGTEGGHTTFAPRDERELAVLEHAQKRFRHVSFERLLSGAGLSLIHQALHDPDGDTELSPPDITQRALREGNAACLETLDIFCAILGTAASNLAVTLGAFGGIYIGGGIVPRLGDYFGRSPFRARFEDKGRFSDYVADIPTYVITAEHATWMGVSAILEAQLRSLPGQSAHSILSQIRRGLETFSRAERRVADHILAHPRAALNDPIADIARAAAVSQPTVIRFCRTLGCEGLSDFKLRLASSLTGTVPVTHAQVMHTDSMVELGSKVMGNTAAAVLQVRDHLNRESIERAVQVLGDAQRVNVHATGYTSIVAQDAQYKLLRLGLACNAYTEPRLHQLAAATLRPGDVALLISSHGRPADLLEVAEQARDRGAVVIALTASQSPLARRADIALLVDHAEDVDTQLPMVSRILHLLLIDILAVGIAVRRGQDPGTMVESLAPTAGLLGGHTRPPPGVTASNGGASNPAVRGGTSGRPASAGNGHGDGTNNGSGHGSGHDPSNSPGHAGGNAVGNGPGAGPAAGLSHLTSHSG